MAKKKTATASEGGGKRAAEAAPAQAGSLPMESPGQAGPAPAHYVVLARKYRPATFDDLIGQDAMVRTLKNAFATDRIAQGYMLTGVRGVGKTTTARILARALNYEREGVDKPTFDMPEFGRHCAEIMEGRHPDVLEMDAASNTGVDNMREIIESARYRPLLARYKVYLVDEVHMLSKGAFNALLKTLEEPPRAREVHLRDDGSAQGAGDRALPLPALRPAPRRGAAARRSTSATSSPRKAPRRTTRGLP